MKYTIHHALNATPTMKFLSDRKRDEIADGIVQDVDFGGLMIVGFVMGSKKMAPAPETCMTLANQIAEYAPFDVDPEKVVFFSGVSQPRAEEYVVKNPEYNVIHTTFPGVLLEMLCLFDENLNLTREQRLGPWNKLSIRLANYVSNNATSIVDDPRPSATFLNHEMPALLKNEGLHTINGVKKWEFWENLKVLDMDVEQSRAFKDNVLKKAASF